MSNKEHRTRMSPRVRTLLLGAASVVLLAAVIFGTSALTDPVDRTGTQPPGTTLSDPDPDSDELTDAAMDALASGDTTIAVQLLQRALVVDPANQAARSQLDRILPPSGSDTPEPPPAPGDVPGTPIAPPGDEPTVTDPDAGFTDPVAEIGVLLPADVDGFELALPVVMGPDASVAADPVEGGPTTSVTRALFAVHDRGSAVGADAFIRDVTRVAYPRDPASVTVDGIPAYFGTDGTRFASVAYKRGRFVFEVVVTTAGGAPAGLKDIALAAARAFPDTAP